MYNPSRGGVRGGADQFSWESVKNDKHRENYLGHSLKAPVGRWQKGKDLSWYAKERKDGDTAEKSDRSALASIKRAEEEAMLIALGHNIVKKETQALSKEEIREALKRNVGDRDDHNIERIDGVGASSQRLALLTNVRQDSRQKKEGVSFEGHRKKNENDVGNQDEKRDDSSVERKSKKKKSKKHKKEKLKKHKKELHSADSDENNYKHKSKQKKLLGSDNDERKLSSKIKSHNKYKKKQKDYSSNDLSADDQLSSKERTHKKVKHKDYSSEELSKPDYSNRKTSSKVINSKKIQQRYMEYSSNEPSESDTDGRKSKYRNHKSKQKHQSYSYDEPSRKHHSHSHKRNTVESCSPNIKRSRHDTSESD